MNDFPDEYEPQVEDHQDVLDAVALLDAIDVSDPEAAHGQANQVLLDWVPVQIREAYQRVVDRADWWACA